LLHLEQYLTLTTVLYVLILTKYFFFAFSFFTAAEAVLFFFIVTVFLPLVNFLLSANSMMYPVDFILFIVSYGS